MSLEGDNSTYKGAALPIVHATLDTEMACFDRLGPQARKAFNDCTFKFAASIWVRHFNERGIDPRHPRIDAQIAAAVYRDEKIGIDSDPQCA